MTQRHPMNLPFAIVFAVFHLGAVSAPFFLTNWYLPVLTLSVWFSTGCFGITLCYHRLLTHGSFETYRWLQYTISIIASVSLQGLARIWVAHHRIHHTHTEVPRLDPHTPRDGRWWSHLDWMLHPDPEYKKKEVLERWVLDLNKQWLYRQRYMLWLPTTVWGIICLIFGGFPAVLWGVCLPIVINWHCTWLVNSATHLWGKRRFTTGHNAKNDSRNNWWVAILTFGEGWHNNHHALAKSARHGFVWYEFDVTWYIIRLLKFLGLVWKVKVAQWDEELGDWVLVELK